jgi:outer membrane autotransporter protein
MNCVASASRNTGKSTYYMMGVSGLALMVGLMASSGASAECTSTLPTFSTKFGPRQISEIIPFGQGGSVNALTSVINTVNTAFLTNTTAFVSAPGDVGVDQQGGGVWSRSVYGNANTTSTGVLTVPTFFGNPVTGSQHCNTQVSQDYKGFQVGADIARLNDSAFGANWHFGVTGGYVQANATDDSTSPSGTFTAGFNVPFVGLYAAMSRGKLFADGQVRFDYFQSELNDPRENGIYAQRMDAKGVSFTGNLGYRFDLAEKWFLEPSVGGVLSRVAVKPIDVTGTLIDPSSPNFAVPGTVQIHDIDSALGRASVRLGTSITSSDRSFIATPFVTAAVYHEFAGDVTTSIATRFDLLGFTDPNSTATLRTSRVGAYGQFGVGSAFQLIDTGWLGYARLDYRTGDSIDGLSINTGVRYQFTPAAGLESLKDAPGGLKDGPSQVINWTGFYVGGSAGALTGSEYWRYPSGDTTDPDFAGYLLGGQVGYNRQMGRIVAGIEADYGVSDARGAKGCPSQYFYSCEANVDSIGSVTGRLGYAWGRALFYAKGGWAIGDVRAHGHLNTGSTDTLIGTFAAPVTTYHWETGWTVGGGMEFALTERWSAKAEYLHYDLGAETFHATVSPASRPEIATEGDLVRVGVNYRVNK